MALTALVFFPGGMVGDGVAQLLQARAGVYRDDHPPLMAWLWHWLDLLVAGPFLMMLLQVGLFWLSLAVLVHALARHQGIAYPRWAPYAVLLWPAVFGWLGTVVKDLLMEALLLGVLALYFGFRQRIVACGPRQPRLYAFALGLALAAALAAAIRFNAFAALPPLLWLCSYDYAHARGAGRAAGTWLGSLAAAIALSGVAVVAMLGIGRALTDEKTHKWQMNAVYDVIGIAYHSGDASSLDRAQPAMPALFPRPLSRDDVARLYSPMTVAHAYRQGGVRLSGNAEQLGRLRWLWLRSIAEQPAAFLHTRWELFWRLMSNHWKTHVAIVPQLRDAQLESVGLVVSPSALQIRLEAALRWTQSLGIDRPDVYLALALALLVGIPLRGWSQLYPVWFLVLSGVSYQAGLFLSTHAPAYRYSHWLVTVVVAAVVLTTHSLVVARGRPTPEDPHLS